MALVDVALLLFACALCSIVVCASERNTVMYSTYVLLSDRIRTCASPVSDLICDSMSRANADQKRADALKYRCYGGYGHKDHEKKHLIIEPQALKEWEELLEKRFAQERSGGASVVVEIANIIKNRQTPKGLDLSDRVATLELLTKWCTTKCDELKINPGSECMVAMHHITLKMDEHHEEIMAGHATTHEKQDQMETKLTRIEEKCYACAQASKRGKKLDVVFLRGCTRSGSFMPRQNKPEHFT